MADGVTSLATLESIGLLVVGWLLGTLSPGLVTAIARRKRRDAIRSAIAVELHELRYKTALVLFQNRRAAATIDKSLLSTVRRLVVPHKPLPGEAPLGEATKQLLSIGDEKYIAAANASGPEPSRGGWHPLHHAPFLASHLEDIANLRPESQRRLLRVIEELHLYNNQVEYIRTLQQMTFTVSGPNHAINASNLTKAHDTL